jgi:hypothetical protein
MNTTTKTRLNRLENFIQQGADVIFITELQDGGFLLDGARYESLDDLPPTRVKVLVPAMFDSPETWAEHYQNKGAA